jgi:hypothetical protein
MGLIREPKNIDFTVESISWTEEELSDFRVLMAKFKAKQSTKKYRSSAQLKKKKEAV